MVKNFQKILIELGIERLVWEVFGKVRKTRNYQLQHACYRATWPLLFDMLSHLFANILEWCVYMYFKKIEIPFPGSNTNIFRGLERRARISQTVRSYLIRDSPNCRRRASLWLSFQITLKTTFISHMKRFLKYYLIISSTWWNSRWNST